MELRPIMGNSTQDIAAGRTGEFMQLLTGAQSRLYAYICSLTGDATGAFDVLQETNLVLWDKAEEYDPARAFGPWAYRIAYLQVLAHRKRRLRSRLVFDEHLMSEMSEELCRRDRDDSQRLEALAGCMEKIPDQRRELLDRRYCRGQSVDEIARQLHKAPNVVSASLYRLRKALLTCIESRLAAD